MFNNNEMWSVTNDSKYLAKEGRIINSENKSVYQLAILALFIISLISLLSIVILAYQKIEVPQSLIAMGSVAVGALGSLFTLSK